MSSADQYPALPKVQVDQWFEWADKSLDEAEKWFDLNFSTCRDTLQDMARCCQSACDVRDMPGALSWQNGAFKPFAERSAEYGARWMGLAVGSGRELSRSLENQWQALARQMHGGFGEKPPFATEWPQAAFGDLYKTMQAFDSIWASARQQMAQSATPIHPPRAGKAQSKVK